MKVALITNYWINSNGGGIREYTKNLVDALKKKNVDVKVLFRVGEDNHELKGPSNKILFVLSSFYHLFSIKPDVVHSHGSWFCLAPGVLYKVFSRAKLVHTFHTEPINDMSPFKKYIFRRMLNFCDCVTFVSKGLRKSYFEIMGISIPKSAITYAGVRKRDVSKKEIDKFRNKFSIPEDSVLLLAQGMTSHLLKANGLKLLIRAVRLLKDEYPSIYLLVTRDGKYVGELKEFSKSLGISDHIIFTGDVENPFVPVFLSDIVVFPWLGRGHGIALLEGMIMRKPVIAFRIEDEHEVIKDKVNGFLVEPVPHKIAQCIKWIIENKEKSEMIACKGEKTVKEGYIWELTAEQFIDIYKGDCL